MKKIILYSIIIFIFSFGIGYYYSKIWKTENISIAEENKIENEIILETKASLEEKVSFDANFALKKYYNECGHTQFNYVELPSEFVNLTQKEVEKMYPGWRVEKFDSKNIVLSQNIDKMCDDHYVLKLGENNIEIYRMQEVDDLKFVRETNISKEYLTEEDIENLEEGIFVFGISNLNSALEDFE